MPRLRAKVPRRKERARAAKPRRACPLRVICQNGTATMFSVRRSRSVYRFCAVRTGPTGMACRQTPGRLPPRPSEPSAPAVPRNRRMRCNPTECAPLRPPRRARTEAFEQQPAVTVDGDHIAEPGRRLFLCIGKPCTALLPHLFLNIVKFHGFLPCASICARSRCSSSKSVGKVHMRFVGVSVAL